MDYKYFRDKVVVITGARRGIGKTLSLMLASAGAMLSINSRNVEKLTDLKNSLSHSGCDVIDIPGDVSVEDVCREIIQRTVDKFGRIDILINNAGIAGEGTVEESDAVIFKKQVEVNLIASYYMTRYALPHIKSTNGSIVFVSSLAGLFGIPAYSGYSASKMALTALAQSLKSELHGQNVHIGIAYVGFTENDPSKEQFNSKGELTTLPKRGVKRVSSEKTASLLLKQIMRRNFKSVHSLLGKTEFIISKFFPGIIAFILRRSGVQETGTGK